MSGRIARAIVRARPLTSTGQLADVVADAVPAAARRRGHPARRVFQALRIAVNDELAELAAALPVALTHLSVGGVCAVISYHSGEDRLTKQLFADAAVGGCTCPPGLPCVCGAVVEHQLVFRGARKPPASEADANPRSKSARLRAVVRIEGEPR
jgi:16S rRNA (cytosine1402-N4)-methyltransferase